VKPLAKIFFYLLISVLVGALVAPWIYLFVKGWLCSHLGSLFPLIASIAAMPFHRYFSRSVQISALVLLWPMVRWLGMYHLADFSLYPNHHARADLLWGIAAAIVPLVSLEVFFIGKGWYVLTPSFHPALLLKFLAAASVVALLEEFFFRGLLLGVSRRAFGDLARMFHTDLLRKPGSQMDAALDSHFDLGSMYTYSPASKYSPALPHQPSQPPRHDQYETSGLGALWFTSLFFAAIHFLNMPHEGFTNVDWSSGLKLCMQVGQGLPIMPLFLGAFANLTILGMILAWVTLRTHSLWLAIGLHAGWIFAQQAFNQMAHFAIHPPELLLPWIGLPQVHGMVPVGMLFFFPMIASVLLLKLTQRFRER
jgi:membrane protease YdiL (CAAX protease family)